MKVLCACHARRVSLGEGILNCHNEQKVYRSTVLQIAQQGNTSEVFKPAGEIGGGCSFTITRRQDCYNNKTVDKKEKQT